MPASLADARQLWFPAHLDYARLGAAYDTFGNFNDEIDGRPLGLVGGVNSPDFQGFLRLEYGLWHGQPDHELVPVANALDAAVHGLIKQFPQMLMPANDLSLRTHEILENTLQFELTGETDEGSHTNLATAWANVQGTQLALAAIAPLLQPGEPGLLASLRQGLDNMAASSRGVQATGRHLDAVAVAHHLTARAPRRRARRTAREAFGGARPPRAARSGRRQGTKAERRQGKTGAATSRRSRLRGGQR